jgi:hypothetical protein
MRIWIVSLMMCLPVLPASAQYSGGSGTADDPYRIATAADLIAIGETRGDHVKHFVLTADIDLDPDLPGRMILDRSVMGRNVKASFSGVFDGDGHTISHLTIVADRGPLGLFGALAATAEVKNLGLVDANIGSLNDNTNVGGLVGLNEGVVTNCYCAGVVTGKDAVGGLVGANVGTISDCHSVGHCMSVPLWVSMRVS